MPLPPHALLLVPAVQEGRKEGVDEVLRECWSCNLSVSSLFLFLFLFLSLSLTLLSLLSLSSLSLSLSLFLSLLGSNCKGRESSLDDRGGRSQHSP